MPNDIMTRLSVSRTRLVDADSWASVTQDIRKLQETLAASEARIAQQQATIDRLMLEYCPDEMTPEQMERWAKSQRIAPRGEHE